MERSAASLLLELKKWYIHFVDAMEKTKRSRGRQSKIIPLAQNKPRVVIEQKCVGLIGRFFLVGA